MLRDTGSRFCYSETGGRVQGYVQRHQPQQLPRDLDTPDPELAIDRPHFLLARRHRLAPGRFGRPSRPSSVERSVSLRRRMNVRTRARASANEHRVSERESE